jgi:NAD dependent epimerase/dehydratase family enzyme
MMRVVLTGATGTIGSAVCAALLAPGDEMVALSRDPERARAVLGDQVEVHARTEPTKRPPAGALAGADAVVHLLGEPIAQRYSEQAMARIRDSRVQGTRLHAAALREVTGDSRPAVLISVDDRLLRPKRQPDVLGDR